MQALPFTLASLQSRLQYVLSLAFVILFCCEAFSADTRRVSGTNHVLESSTCTSPVKPKITLNGPPTICTGGSVLLTASSGKSYKWSNGASSQSITVTQSGDYFVEVVDANGCVGKSETVKIEVAGKLVAPKIEYTDPLIVCDAGSIKMSVSEQEGASYIWKKDGVPVYDKSNEFTATEAGVYTVELSNFCGYVRSSNKVDFRIQKPIPAFEVEATGKLVFCKGGSVKLAVPQYQDVTYAWFRDGQPISGSSFELVAEEAGNYTAAITSECGTFKSVKGQKVELLALPEAPTAKNVTGCTKAALTLTATGGTAGKYRWYTQAKGGAAIAGVDGASYTTPVLTNSTTYYVAITNGLCESERVPVEAIINEKPAVPTIEVNGVLEFCEGGAVELSIKAYKNQECVWFRNGKEVASGANSINATESGEYTVQLKNDCGATLSSNKIKVTVWPAPAPPVVQHGSTCGPGEVKLTASGGKAGEYKWYDNVSSLIALEGFTGDSFTTPVLQTSQTYYVSLVSNGCETERVPVQANVYAIPVAVANVSDDEIDAGETVQLTGSGGAHYSWSPAIGLSDSKASSPVATPDETTRYTLTVKNEEGCEDTTSVVVTVRQLLEIPNAFSPNGDGVNDTWEIKNIEYFPDAKVEVYNRWGSLVFEKVSYRNEWHGTYRGARLPVSTYFYVITIPGKNKFTGYLNIVN